MKIIHKIIEDVVIPVLMLIFLLVVGVPLMIIEDIWLYIRPHAPEPDPREMSDEELRRYYGYDERRDDNG